MRFPYTSRGVVGPWILAAVLIAAATVVAWVLLTYRATEERLVSAEPARVLADPQLVALARRLAAPVYRQHCASCHGAQGQGGHGVPALADADWLYGNNPVGLEQIVLYGIRSGHPRARNVTDMPGMGRSGQLTDAEVEDVVQFVLQLSGQAADAGRASSGRQVFYAKGNCFDCHASDARGVTDYGTPSLRGPHWMYGGDHDSLYRSVYDGRHGLCPSRAHVLSALEARALAISLHEGWSK